MTAAIPFFDDLAEAVGIICSAATHLEEPDSVEWLLLQIYHGKARGIQASALPPHTRILPASDQRALPAAKNGALHAASADLVLFLSPPLLPLPGSLELMQSQLRSHREWCGICGLWRNARGEVEKGYNVRSFPSRLALFYDLLLINKLWPANAATRSYKMHDFDHQTARPVEHALDYALLVRKDVLLSLGGFDEGYRFGWFDQVDLCHKAQKAGFPFWYDPAAGFHSSEREPLLDRLLAVHYSDFYADQQRYVSLHFGSTAVIMYRMVLSAGLVLRLAFASILTLRIRKKLLATYRSYVDDDYIQSMKRSYRATLRSTVFGSLRRRA
ncbi:MAG TPA: hypothetical protein VE398_17130 [Acidobacteriota bacterium]|nr:hypothetical protein [Acidobacteriota bacterium]